MPKRISPAEAWELMSQQGYTYVDVRSEAEFRESHPKGAVNIPILHMGPGGRTPNPKFLEAFQQTFPEGSRVILGCAGGMRSMSAAHILEREGYDDLMECRTGFGGARDHMGQVVEAGWSDCGLPCDQGEFEGKSWKSIEDDLD